MSNKNLKNYDNIKKTIRNITENLSIKIGIYDDANNLSEEKIVPLGNYIQNPFPTEEELMMTKFLSSSYSKK